MPGKVGRKEVGISQRRTGYKPPVLPHARSMLVGDCCPFRIDTLSPRRPPLPSNTRGSTLRSKPSPRSSQPIESCRSNITTNDLGQRNYGVKSPLIYRRGLTNRSHSPTKPSGPPPTEPGYPPCRLTHKLGPSVEEAPASHTPRPPPTSPQRGIQAYGPGHVSRSCL